MLLFKEVAAPALSALRDNVATHATSTLDSTHATTILNIERTVLATLVPSIVPTIWDVLQIEIAEHHGPDGALATKSAEVVDSIKLTPTLHQSKMLVRIAHMVMAIKSGLIVTLKHAQSTVMVDGKIGVNAKPTMVTIVDPVKKREFIKLHKLLNMVVEDALFMTIKSSQRPVV